LFFNKIFRSFRHPLQHTRRARAGRVSESAASIVLVF
jgi:hypothetical protein